MHMQTKSKSLSATWSFCLMAALSFPQLQPLAAAESEAAEPGDVSGIGTLSGFVVNVANGTFLNGVAVRTRPSAGQAVSNLDGIFHMDVPAGTYELEVRKEGYVSQIIRGINVAVGETAFQDVALNPLGGVNLGEVTVVAEADQASEAALLVERKTAPTVSDAIGAQEMSRMVGSDASDVMQRVTGVSIVDSKYVYIRGLGERYSSTMLNGAVVPSTRPDKKVVPMDLFPAALMQNIRTEKSYTPDQPGEFSGGLVKMSTVDFPRSPILKLSYGTSFGSTTTFKDFADYPGGSRDWLGFDDGTRSLPSGIPNERLTRRGRFSTTGFTSDELQGFGRSFSNVWTPGGGQNAFPNQSFNFMAGNTFGKLGVVLALSHGNKWHRQEEVRNYYRSAGQGELSPLREYEMDYSTRSILTGLTANFAYELTDNNRIQFQNFFSKDTSDESRFFEGFDSDGQQRVRNQRIRMIEEDVGSTKVSGEHYLTALGNSFLTWRLSYSLSSLDEPDLREALYEERNDRFLLADESQSGFRLFNDLDEDIWEPGLDWTTYFNRGIVNSSIKVGASYRSRQRDFLSRRFRFVPLRTAGIDLSQPPERILAADNINPSAFELREETRPTDTYDAKQLTRAGYAMLDLSIDKWRFIGGARVEADSQRVETFDPFDRTAPTGVSTRLDNTDLLPAFSVVYRLDNDMNLRGGYGKTLNRPEFRELSPFEFTDVVGGRAVVGNPELVRARIQNWDVRWEWFMSSTELLSASFFFKDFENPIEREIQLTAQLRTSYINAQGAKNLGMELETRKNLGGLSSSLENFFVSANYTLVDSAVEISREQAPLLTNLNRALEGQSRHVFNGVLQYEHPTRGSMARLLYNYQGQRISDVGAQGLPDVVQVGVPRMDAVFIQPLAKSWRLKFSAENLLDHQYEFRQGDRIQRSYRVGRSFSVSISKTFFRE